MPLLPVVKEELLEGLMASGYLIAEHQKEIVDILERENPILYEMISNKEIFIEEAQYRAQHVEKAYKYGMLYVYELLRKQAESDQLNKQWEIEDESEEN